MTPPKRNSMPLRRGSRIFVAGHNGMVGSAVCRLLEKEGFSDVITRDRSVLDLLDQQSVRRFFAAERPEYVVLAAAKVGGIMANREHQADFLYENLQIQNNVIWHSHLSGVAKLMFLGSSCIYPRECPQPMKEEYLLDGKPEPTNEGYAIAKIAGMKLCEKIFSQYGKTFISCMPTNLYGPGDNFELESSHVLPALIRKFHEAKVRGEAQVVVWGDGSARREFLHVDDLASAVLFLMDNHDDSQFVNVGTGKEISIGELVQLIKEVVGYQGEIVFDTSKPNGMPRKLLDMTRLHTLGWRHSTDLEQGLKEVYMWYVDNIPVRA